MLKNVKRAHTFMDCRVSNIPVAECCELSGGSVQCPISRDVELGTDVGHVELWSYQPNDLQALKLSEISENSDDNSYMICYIYIYRYRSTLII